MKEKWWRGECWGKKDTETVLSKRDGNKDKVAAHSVIDGLSVACIWVLETVPEKLNYCQIEDDGQLRYQKKEQAKQVKN